MPSAFPQTVAAVSATPNKHDAWPSALESSPPHSLFTLADDPALAARKVPYPCVLKPTILAASRGVIRVNHEGEFVRAFRRIETILKSADVVAQGAGSDEILVEGFIQGREVALEGLLVKGLGYWRFEARPRRAARRDDLRRLRLPAETRLRVNLTGGRQEPSG
jgi:biotin carboxylase